MTTNTSWNNIETLCKNKERELKQISRAELKAAYETMSVRKAAARFGVSVATFYKLLDRAGIKLRGKREAFEIID